jgi:phosphoserine phosphatase RsbX
VGQADAAPLEWAVAQAARQGEDVSGDAYVVAPFDGGTLVAVVDGLGHGPEAARVAQIAITTLQERPADGVEQLIRRCHDVLMGTRGVVMTLASFSASACSFSWLGVGDVEAFLFRAAPALNAGREHVLLRGGVVGYQLPPLRAAVVTVAIGDTLILATDGIDDGFTALQPSRSQPPREIAEHILARYSKGSDDALVLVARCLEPPR